MKHNIHELSQIVVKNVIMLKKYSVKCEEKANLIVFNLHFLKVLVLCEVIDAETIKQDSSIREK